MPEVPWSLPNSILEGSGRVLGVSWASRRHFKRFLAALGRFLGGFKARLGCVFAALEHLWTAKCWHRQTRPRFCIDFYSILASFCQAPLAEMPTKALPLSFFFLRLQGSVFKARFKRRLFQAAHEGCAFRNLL